MHNSTAAPQHDSAKVALALQGGGALGAFTWGVLDALLEADVPISGVSGASAGAVNAVVMAQGLMDGGAPGARAGLARFWRRVSNAFPLSGAPASGATLAAMQAALQWMSPAQLNPLRIDPLKAILEDEVDFAALRTGSPIGLLVSATRVSDGRARIFHTHELDVAAVLASACLPLMNHSVEIDGEWYWDGGYSANPPLRELAWANPGQDILLVDLMTPSHGRPPSGVRDIERRVHEIALTSSMHRELDALDDLIRLGRVGQGPLARPGGVTLHRVSAGDAVSAADAMNADWTALSRLMEAGRDAGRVWLESQRPALKKAKSRARAAVSPRPLLQRLSSTRRRSPPAT